jgi:soluble lytic murein transglycosylase-like protein
MLEERALDWLVERQEARSAAATVLDEPELLTQGDVSAVDRATAIDPSELNRQQAAVAQWLSRRYKVAPEPVGRLVQESWSLGKRVGLEPTLILAIVAIESSFNPFAQSAVGAQGLMQVLTRVHDDKYVAFGGNHAAFDPLTNLRVGVQVLKDCIAKAGSVEEGLRHYVGAANLASDGGYAFKVLAEQEFLLQLIKGRSVPVTARLPVPPVSPPAEPVPGTTPTLTSPVNQGSRPSAAAGTGTGANPVLQGKPDRVAALSY